MNQAVHIIAVGARTPLGSTAESSMAAVRAGISQISDHPFIFDGEAEPIQMVRDLQLDPGFMGPERLIEMASSALEEICQSLSTYALDISNIPLLLCLPEERPGWAEEHAEIVKDGLDQKVMSLSFRSTEIFSQGHAAGLVALDTACKEILSKKAELCVILGVDSYLTLETLVWLDENRQLATAYHRGAFFPGEGAGAFAVASDAFVQREAIDVLASIRGIGTAKESHLINTETLCLGVGLTECVREAVSSLRLPEEAIQGIICDINGERYRSEEWGFSLLRLPKVFVDPTDYEMPASCWGDVGAASGPLFVVLAVIAGMKKWAKGSRYIIWNSSDAGQRAAAVLELNFQLQG